MARRRIEIEVLVDPALAQKGFRQTGAAAKLFGKNVEQAGRGALTASVGFKGLGRSVAFASGAFLGGAGFIAAVKSSVNAASNLNEQLSKSGVVFGKSSASVEAWSKTTVKSMGLAEDQALETASSFGALLRPIGLTGSAAARQSTKLTKLGADLASFYNTSVQDALDAIRSGLVGEVEPLRRYGVLLSETRVQQEALKETGKAHATQLTVQEKLLARLTLIYKDTTQAQGDFVRTSGGLANQQRILSANIRQLQIGIGQALIPEVLKVTTRMNEWLGKSRNQAKVTDAVRQAVATLKSVVAAATPIVGKLASVTETVTKMLGGARHAIELLLIAMAVKKVQSFATSIRLVGAESAVATGRIAGMRGALASLPAFVGVTVGLDIIANAKTDKNRPEHGFASWSGKGGWGKFANDIAGVVHADWRRPNQHSAVGVPIHPGEMATTAAQTHRMPATFGTSGTGSAGSPASGMAALSRAQRNSLALAMARTPAQEMAALAEQRSILANQIRSVRGRMGGARGQQLSKLTDQLRDLESQDTSAFQQIASIKESSARDAQASTKRIKDAEAKKKQAMMDSVRAAIGGFGAHLGVDGGRLTIGDVNRAVTKNEQNARAASAARNKALQFRALGLSGTGDELTPTRKGLLTQTNRIAAALKGTMLDTKQNRNLIAGARRVLNQEWGKLNSDVARRMRDMLDAIDPSKQSGMAKLFTGHGINLAKITAGLGLTGAQARAVQFKIAGQHLSTMSGPGQGFIGASRPVVIQVNGAKNPKQTAREVQTALKKEFARGAQQVRGPFAGKRGI